MTETTDLRTPSPTANAAAVEQVPTATEPEKLPHAGDQSAKIVIFSVNDVYDMTPNEHGHGGIAEFATLLERQKDLLPDDVTLLVTLNGDFLSGSEMGERFKGCVGLCRIAEWM
jgi:hypothetical protein